ncbi:hypothetical protein JdFRA1000001_38c [uncultured archaeal virus]|uniref:SpoVT-AbrB domain-containing protein n=1 Tax=uncultured archaeal virus TaxID=1960247 RepID=A0A1S5Y2Y5_9VIRU|nr:hypothetical protein JdFRA1000001_38c [uncultured archaeal virus]
MNRNIGTSRPIYIFTRRILDDGKVTIPKDIRSELDVDKGDLVLVMVTLPGDFITQLLLRKRPVLQRRSLGSINSTIIGNWIEFIEDMRKELEREIPVPLSVLNDARKKLSEASEALAILQVNLQAVEEVVQENE